MLLTAGALSLYWMFPSAHTKMLPALSMISAVTDRRIIVGVIIASIGDYLLEASANPHFGILAFSGFHLILLYCIESVYLKHQYTLPPLAVLSTFIASHFDLYLGIPIFCYALLLSFLLSSAILLNTTHTQIILKNKLRFLVGVVLFIISDLFVVGDWLYPDAVPKLGLPIYWLSLRLIISAFH